MMADPPRGPILLTVDWGQRGGQRARHGVHGWHRVGLGPGSRGQTHGLEGGAVILGVGCTGGIDPHYTPDLGTAGRGAGGNSMIGAVLVGGRVFCRLSWPGRTYFAAFVYHGCTKRLVTAMLPVGVIGKKNYMPGVHISNVQV